jgi:hypothetical protein
MTFGTVGLNAGNIGGRKGRVMPVINPPARPLPRTEAKKGNNNENNNNRSNNVS